MRLQLKLFVLILLVLSAPPALAADKSTITLLVNGSETVTLPDNTQVMVGDESKLAVRLVTPTQLLMKGLAPGYTDVWLINDTPQRLRVTIERPLDERLELELSALQQVEPDLRITRHRNFVIADGTVSAVSEEKLSVLASQYQQLLVQTEVTLTDPPMLRLSVKILEIKRQQLRQLGIEWQSATSGPTAATAIKGMFAWSAQMESTLNLLQQQGHAKLLASPTLSAQSGESAAFLAGGEIPIPQVVAQGMQDVEFREYGIKLNIAPEVTATDKIKTVLSAEVSNLDPAVSVNGVPGILTRRTDSVFLAAEGTTLVLSGLLSHEHSLNESAIPGLSDVPLLGKFFQAREQRQQQTELVIMVTTERLDAAEQRHQQQWQRQQQQQHWLEQAGCVGLQEVNDE